MRSDPTSDRVIDLHTNGGSISVGYSAAQVSTGWFGAARRWIAASPLGDLRSGSRRAEKIRASGRTSALALLQADCVPVESTSTGRPEDRCPRRPEAATSDNTTRSLKDARRRKGSRWFQLRKCLSAAGQSKKRGWTERSIVSAQGRSQHRSSGRARHREIQPACRPRREGG